MKLFLASEAKHPDIKDAMQSFVGGFEGKSIAYIPTALNGIETFGLWKETSSTWKYIQTLSAGVTPVVLEEYRDKSVVESLKHKDIIWIAGGSCSYLMYWMLRCELDHYLPELLNAGSIYVGSSASSMIAAPTLALAEWYIGETEAHADDMKGLNLVDFDIYPHYEDALLPQIKSHTRNIPMYLLKNGEAITLVEGVVSVIGEKRLLLPTDR